MRLDLIRRVLLEDGAERDEAYRIFNEYYPSLSSTHALKFIFYPMKVIFNSEPHVPKRKFVFDSINFEKFKRMLLFTQSKANYLVYLSDLSSQRSVKFRSSLDSEIEVVHQIFRFRRYFSILPSLISSSLTRTAFLAKAAQLLIRYDWILDKTEAKVLVTANEDSWIAPLAAKYCRLRGVVNLNVMHGRAYDALQFYDYSVVFGKSSLRKIEKLAGPQTKVVALTLPEVDSVRNNLVNRFENSKSILFFDQPVFDFYSQALQDQIYHSLCLLAEKGYRVAVKPHPSQTISQNFPRSKIELIAQGTNEEILKNFGIAAAVCSTVGIESVACQVPIIYLNVENVLTKFTQIKAFESSAVESIDNFIRLVNDLQAHSKYSEYLNGQIEALQEEYCASPDASISDLFR